MTPTCARVVITVDMSPSIPMRGLGRQTLDHRVDIALICRARKVGTFGYCAGAWARYALASESVRRVSLHRFEMNEVVSVAPVVHAHGATYIRFGGTVGRHSSSLAA